MRRGKTVPEAAAGRQSIPDSYQNGKQSEEVVSKEHPDALRVPNQRILGCMWSRMNVQCHALEALQSEYRWDESLYDLIEV